MPPKRFAEEFLEALNDQRVVDRLGSILLPQITILVEAKVMEAITPLTGNVNRLLEENKVLSAKLEEMDRYTRSYNIIINGLDCKDYSQAASSVASSNPDANANQSLTTGPEVSHESTTKLVSDFFKETLDINIGPIDISAAHFLPRRRNQGASSSATPGRSSSSIIVRFNSKNTRDQVFGARKSLKGSRIYINDHLTMKNNELFARARHLLKENKLAGTWTSNGHDYAKLGTTPDSKPFRVTCVSDLPV